MQIFSKIYFDSVVFSAPKIKSLQAFTIKLCTSCLPSIISTASPMLHSSTIYTPSVSDLSMATWRQYRYTWITLGAPDISLSYFRFRFGMIGLRSERGIIASKYVIVALFRLVIKSIAGLEIRLLGFYCLYPIVLPNVVKFRIIL